MNVRMPALSRTPNIVWRRDLVGMYGFGVTYGLAASGCSAPLFLSDIALALGAGAFLGAGILLLYGIGMGSAFIITAVLVAQGRESTVKRIKNVTPLLHKISAVLLIIAGLYTLWFDLHGIVF